MSFDLKIQFAPAHELLLSFLLFKRPERLKYLDVGKDWASDLSNSLDPDFLNEINNICNLCFFDFSVLFMEESTESETIPEFLERMCAYSPGELYETISAFLLPGQQIPHDLGKERDNYVSILRQWDQAYFSKLPETMLSKLRNSYQETCLLKDSMSDVDLIEKVTGGLRIDTEQIHTVFLIPAFHFRPLSTNTCLKGKLFILYPLSPEFRKDRIITVGKALADERRLNILRLLSGGTYSFTEIVKEIGSGKGNIHHHMMILRATGLVRMHIEDECFPNISYSLRNDPIKELYGEFCEFVKMVE